MHTNALTIHGRNPLWHAIRSEAPRNVIVTLSHPEHLDCNGVDSKNAIIKGARLLKSDGLVQQALNKSLSRCKVFSNHDVFMMIAHLCAVEDLLYMDSEQIQETNHLVQWYTVIFVGSSMLLVLRELVKLFSQKGQYSLQIQNLYEWVNIGLLLSIVAFIENEMNDDRFSSFCAAFITLGISLCFHLMLNLRLDSPPHLLH